MDNAYMTGVSGLLADFADLLSHLDLAELPALAGLDFDYDPFPHTWCVRAQLWAVSDDEEQIAAVNAWAAALGGALNFDATEHGSIEGGTYHYLEAVKALDFGVSFHVWTHIARTPALVAV